MSTQSRIVWKELELFVEKVLSMHLPVTGSVAHLNHTQHTLSQGRMDQAWLSRTDGPLWRKRQPVSCTWLIW